MKKIIIFLICFFCAVYVNAQFVQYNAIPNPRLDINIRPFSMDKTVTIVKTNIETYKCYDQITNTNILGKLKFTYYSDNSIRITLIGKKRGSNSWSTADCEVMNIDELLSNDDLDNNARSTLLELSDNFSFLTIEKNKNILLFYK